jgi:hypothetical protein
MWTRVFGLALMAALVSSAARSQAPAPQEPAPKPEPVAAGQPGAGDTYVAYGSHDPTKILGTRRDADGHDHHFVDMQVVHAILDDLVMHAANYPPDLRTDDERQRAQSDARALGGMLDVLIQPEDAPVEMLLLASRVHAIAHNLDVPDAAAQATKGYERILAREPENAQANFHFGVFLASTGTRSKDAAACLEKAARLGMDGAWFSLGMLQLTLGDRDHALASLENYAKKFPDDAGARKLIEGLRDGSLKIEQKLN